MGCGKTTIGSALAAALDYPFVDLDQYIETQENTTVNDLFTTKGEMYFRALERQSLHQLIASTQPQVIALGGGTPCYYNNIKLITSKSHTSYYLKATIKTLSKRLWTEKQHRPMLHHMANEQALEEFIGKHLFERNYYYQQAKKTLLIDGKSVATLVAEIQSDLT